MEPLHPGTHIPLSDHPRKPLKLQTPKNPTVQSPETLNPNPNTPHLYTLTPKP